MRSLLHHPEDDQQQDRTARGDADALQAEIVHRADARLRADPSAQHRPEDADEDGHDETAAVAPRQQEFTKYARDQAHSKGNNDGFDTRRWSLHFLHIRRFHILDMDLLRFFSVVTIDFNRKREIEFDPLK